MFKRPDGNRENEYSLPAKRAKYNTNSTTLTRVSKGNEAANTKSDDIWGDDFAEEDIEEMDYIATQACLQEDISFSQPNRESNTSSMQRFSSMPSTSKFGLNLNSNDSKVSKSSTLMLQRKEVLSLKDTSTIASVDYKDFEDKLMNRKIHNSTFKLDINRVSETEYAKELEKLKVENKKLLDDFITKEGEAVFLRNQLVQTQLRSENDKLEKTRFIEEQEKRHREEINAICKEKEQLKTQLELQTFEVGNLMERCKLLEGRSVKLTEPQSANLNSSLNRSRFSSPRHRSSASTVRPVKVKEICVQTNVHNKSLYPLKIWNLYYPLSEIPKLIYDMPQPEKSVVDIQVIERTGCRNLPILQEENTCRIFENPELVKPVTTMINDKILTVEFILPEISILQGKTNLELESEATIFIINKLISTARELILNVIIVLRTILQAMNNDDIRDMNDIYFSDLYSSSDFNGMSVCTANAWHECERGVETRRVFGVLSYIALESVYLSKYIAGKTPLLVNNDESYKHYSRDMVRYSTWSEKDENFEMLRMLLQFVTLIGSTRRAHQFSGLICAIMMLVCNVHKKVGYCSEGMEYVYRIFKEIVFSKPLPYCYALLSNIILIFIKSPIYLSKICINSQSMAVNNWKGSLHFTSDACPLQIYLAQVESYQFDLITAIDITEVLLQFSQYILQIDVIPLRPDSINSCNCCMKLLRFTIKTLSKCTEVNLSSVGSFNANWFPLRRNESCKLKNVCNKHSPFLAETNRTSRKCIHEIYRDKFADENVWTSMKRKQLKMLRDGIRFLSHLAICDPDFIIRLSDIEDAFHLFIRNISSFDNLVLHENEQEAMNRIKQTFILDKVPQSEETETISITKRLNILLNFGERSVEPSSTSSKKNENHYKALTIFKSLYRQ